MCVLQVAICFVGACFGISCSISANGLHAHKGIVGLLLGKGGGRAGNGLVVCVEGDNFLFERFFVVVVYIPCFELRLEIVDSIQEFGDLCDVVGL